MENTLQKLKAHELLSRTQLLVAEERKITLSLIEHLSEINRRMLYLEMGYGSLFEFAVKHLGLSEGSAHRRIAAMRLVQEVPEARAKLETGALSVTNAAKIQVAFRTVKKSEILTVSDKSEIVERCSGVTQKECESTLISALPTLIATPAYTEKVRTVGADTLELKLIIPKPLREKIERLVLLDSHSNPELSYLKLLERLVDQALSKRSTAGQKKAHRSGKKEATNPRAISKSERALVFKRAGHQCQFPGCASRYQLQVDHIKPVALGGTGKPENLRILCGKHNRYEANRILG